MKRRYKLLIIILTGSILTILINGTKIDNKISVTAIGDSLSLGMTPYNVAGDSFNDYFKEHVREYKKIKKYNNEFTKNGYVIKDLNDDIKNNVLGNVTNIPIKQTLASSNIVTIAIGEDEFNTNEVDSYTKEKYLNNYEEFLKELRKFYNNKIIVISMYPTTKFYKKDVIDLNNNLRVICGKYNASFIDILPLSMNKEYYFDDTSYYLNYKAHKKISEDIYEISKSLIL